MKETVEAHLVFTTCIKEVPAVKPGDVSEVHLITGNSGSCSTEEIERAAQEVKTYFAGQFRFKDCKLTVLEFLETHFAEKTGETNERVMAFRGFFEIGEEPAFGYKGMKFATCIWEVKWDGKQENWNVQHLQNL